jgi:hypothetical protein
MIAINMLEPLKVLFLISMLIFVEYLDRVNRIMTKKIIVSTTGMKNHGMWDKALDELGKKVCELYPLFVNFAMTRVILIFNAQAIIVTLLIE